MKYALLVKAEAIQDVTEAFNWYEHKRTGLGIEFLDEVEDTMTVSAKIRNSINLTVTNE